MGILRCQASTQLPWHAGNTTPLGPARNARHNFRAFSSPDGDTSKSRTIEKIRVTTPTGTNRFDQGASRRESNRETGVPPHKERLGFQAITVRFEHNSGLRQSSNIEAAFKTASCPPSLMTPYNWLPSTKPTESSAGSDPSALIRKHFPLLLYTFGPVFFNRCTKKEQGVGRCGCLPGAPTPGNWLHRDASSLIPGSKARHTRWPNWAVWPTMKVARSGPSAQKC